VSLCACADDVRFFGVAVIEGERMTIIVTYDFWWVWHITKNTAPQTREHEITKNLNPKPGPPRNMDWGQ
jgi:hypothetical protein